MAGCGDERAGDGMDELKSRIETMVVVALEREERVTGRHLGCAEERVCHNTMADGWTLEARRVIPVTDPEAFLTIFLVSP